MRLELESDDFKILRGTRYQVVIVLLTAPDVL